MRRTKTALSIPSTNARGVKEEHAAFVISNKHGIHATERRLKSIVNSIPNHLFQYKYSKIFPLSDPYHSLFSKHR
jgi:hypothetical protein